MVLNQITKLLGISMRESEDILIRDQLASTASAINCRYGSLVDQPTSISAQDVDITVQTLANNDAEYLLNQIGGEDKFGTSPVQDAFLAFASTNLMADLRNVGGFTLKSSYPNDKSVLKSEYGQIGGLRFLLSSQASVSENASYLGNNVYNIICPAVESYACIDQDMASAQLIYIPPYVNSKLALFCSLGYKYTQASTLLNDAWIVNLRCVRQLGT